MIRPCRSFNAAFSGRVLRVVTPLLTVRFRCNRMYFGELDMKRHSMLLAVALTMCSGMADAAIVTYNFVGAVTQVDPLAQDFPSSLGGLAFGDRFSGTLSYESASPVDPVLPQPSLFGATPYRLNAFNLSLAINGVTFDSWEGIPAAYVWNDVPAPSGFDVDAVMFVNVGTLAIPPDSPQFVLGSAQLPTGTFATDALPVVSMPERFFIRMKSVASADDWFRGDFDSGRVAGCSCSRACGRLALWLGLDRYGRSGAA